MLPSRKWDVLDRETDLPEELNAGGIPVSDLAEAMNAMGPIPQELLHFSCSMHKENVIVVKRLITSTML